MDPMSKVFLCLFSVIVLMFVGLYLYERAYGQTTIRDLFWSREEQERTRTFLRRVK